MSTRNQSNSERSSTFWVLHFADAHIDMANYGRHDPESALPIRVMDFLASLDQIVDKAVEIPVDLVIFAGDAYKDRNPQPTFQRAWGQRIMRLSQANIPTLLLVGNHDKAPAAGRANTVQEFHTLGVPNIHVADKLDFWGPDRLGLPVQVITVPWISRSALLTREEMSGKSLEEIFETIENRLSTKIQKFITEADPDIPLILAAHASVHGAKYGSERAVMLGQELVLSEALVKNKRLDYVALGHIHKHQSLNGGSHPPVIYPGSIERIDFGEAREKKGFVVADVSQGKTEWKFIPLKTRPFIDRIIEPETSDGFMEKVLENLPAAEDLKDAICRLQLIYPRDWEPLVDEATLHDYFQLAFSIQILKHRQTEKRSRLGDIVSVEELAPEELLEQYWLSTNLPEDEIEAMQALAQEIFSEIVV